MHGLIYILAVLMMGQPIGQRTNPSRGEASPGPSSSPALRKLKEEAEALKPLYNIDWVQRFLKAVDRLPAPGTRAMLKDEKKGVYFSQSQAGNLGNAYRHSLLATEATEIFYYYTKYGSPLAYARPLEIVGQQGFTKLQEKKILDFGYGGVGHLRLLASLGANVVGVDVDPLLPALYSAPTDQGSVAGEGGTAGTVALLHGRFPIEDRVRGEVGGGYDLVISKNTLKMGYIHPSRKADDRLLIKLGVDDKTFAGTIYSILKPGSYFLIYNLCPAQAPDDKPFIPWADGRCPFPKETLESAGFKIIVLDKDDSTAARQMGHALGWDSGEGAMDLQKDLFATYTLLQRPPK